MNAACPRHCWCLSLELSAGESRETVAGRLSEINPRSVVGAIFYLGSNTVRFETCWHKHDDDTHLTFELFKVIARDRQ